MKIKHNETLAYVAAFCGKTSDEAGIGILRGLMDAGYVNDTPDNYGCMLSEAIQGNAMVADVVEIYKKALGVPVISSNLWDCINGCIVMGDGDCPECGGEMIMEDAKSHTVSSHDIYLPDDYVDDWQLWRCPICGHTIERDYRPDNY